MAERKSHWKAAVCWLHFIVIWCAGPAATLHVYHIGGILLVMVGVGWGASIGLAMDRGIRSATEEAWNKSSKSSKLNTPTVLWFLLIVLVPAEIALFFARPTTAVSLALHFLTFGSVRLRFSAGV